jgi:long-chain acyl-CoA synthetase
VYKRPRPPHGRAEAPFTHANPVYGRVRRGHIGLPVTDTVAAVVAAAHPERPLPPGTEGTLAIHGPQVASGVLTQQGPVPADGWLLTGHRAVMDEDGSFELRGGGAG